MGDAPAAVQRVIHCWSGPRCVSTALMYSFAQRRDVEVVDEPLYAHFLRTHPAAARPYREAVLAAQDGDGAAVVRQLQRGAAQPGRVLFAKHMAKQRLGLGPELLRSGRHFLLVREPEAVIRSFGEVLEATLAETCYTSLLELASELRALGAAPPVIILSDDLVSAPEPTLRALCAALDLPFDPGMLAWPPGPRPEDGCWAPWWYRATHASSGFGGGTGPQEGAAAGAKAPLPAHLRALLEDCRPLYEALRRRALRPAPQPPSPPPPSPSPAPAPSPGGGTHAYAPDPRNADVLIGIRDGVSGRYDLVWRPEARLSVLDAGFVLGDGVWEGLRVHRGVLLFAGAHLRRLFEGATALDLDLGLTPGEVRALVYRCLDANGMAGASGVHVRLMATRGLKATPYQHPAATVGGATVVVIPEHKEADPAVKARGIRLFTVHVRRGGPDVQDPALNSHSKLNCILACIQASKAGADEALMLDPRGFVATCNSTNFFAVRDGTVLAPGPQYQMPGITRAKVLALCAAAGIPAREGDLSLAQVYSADEAFVTGTFAGQIPVVEVDGRRIGDGARGPVTARLQALYAALCDEEAARGR